MAIYLVKAGNNVKAYGDIESLQGAGVSADLVITDAQWDNATNCAHVENGEIVLGASSEVLAERIRDERDRRLEQDVDGINAIRWAEMSKTERTKWTNYRKALLDIPQQQGFPWDGTVDWPVKPE